MNYINDYLSPVGRLFMTADDTALTGLYFETSATQHLASALPQKELPIFHRTRQWLDIYFSGKNPIFIPPFHLNGTLFQIEVWKLLLKIPYGQTTTYGEIAAQIARQRGDSHMSAQAVGQAVGRNPISIIFPCHRVIGKNGTLTGYAGGLDKKKQLLAFEHIFI